MAKYTPEFKEQVKQAYLSGNGSLATIAVQFSIGQRTIKGWSKEGNWDTLRKAQNVIPIGEAKSKTQPSKPQPVNNLSPTPTREPVRVRRRDRGEIDELEIVESAISSLHLLFTDMATGPDEDEDGRIKPIDTRGIGTTAGALVKLLEYRRKIQPPTAAELAEQAIGLGVSPAEFARELRQAWEKRA